MYPLFQMVIHKAAAKMTDGIQLPGGGLIDGDEFDPDAFIRKTIAPKLVAAKKLMHAAMIIPSYHPPIDIDGDKIITAGDCPFPLGSAKAKLWWKNQVVPYTRTQITPEMKAEYGAKLKGAYKGKPLVPGEAGKGQGDFDFLVDRLRVNGGYPEASARAIAGKIRTSLYPRG